MKIKTIQEYAVAMNSCNNNYYDDRATYDHDAFPSANFKKSTATFNDPARSNLPASNTGYLIGGITTWITKSSNLAIDYTSYSYSDSTPITVYIETEETSNSIDTGGSIVSTYYSTGGLAYSSTYVVTGYSSIGLLNTALLSAHASVPFGSTLGNYFDSQQSSYTVPIATAAGPHVSAKTETKIRWGAYAKKGKYFKATFNIITWTAEYRAWWVEHLAGRPEPYPEPSVKPTLGAMQTVEWFGTASGSFDDPSRYNLTEYLIPAPSSGYISEVINQKIYGYRSAAFGCPPNPSPFIY